MRRLFKKKIVTNDLRDEQDLATSKHQEGVPGDFITVSGWGGPGRDVWGGGGVVVRSPSTGVRITTKRTGQA